METVADLMTPRPEVAPHQEPLSTSLERMTRLGVHYLPVVDSAGRLLALATEADLRRYSRRGVTGLPVGQVAQRGPTAHPADDAIRTLARQLSDGHSATVVIDEDEHPVGMLTWRESLSLARVALTPWLQVADVARMGPVHTIHPELTAQAALEELRVNRLRHLVVTEHDRVVGVFSPRELAGYDNRIVRTLLGRVVRTIGATENIREAMLRLAGEPVGCVPVLSEEGAVIGLLSGRDVVRALCRQLIASSTVPPVRRR